MGPKPSTVNGEAKNKAGKDARQPPRQNKHLTALSPVIGLLVLSTTAFLMSHVTLRVLTPIFGCVFASDGLYVFQRAGVTLGLFLSVPSVMSDGPGKNADAFFETCLSRMLLLGCFLSWLPYTISPLHLLVSKSIPQPEIAAMATGLILSPLLSTPVGGVVYGLASTLATCTSIESACVWMLLSAGGMAWAWVLAGIAADVWHIPGTCVAILGLAVCLLVTTWVLKIASGRMCARGTVLSLALLIGVAMSATMVPSCRTCVGLEPNWPCDRFRLLARNESVTGTISVIDDTVAGLRVMKADHSLLGGRFHDPEQSSIYSIFHVHEAVRLARPTGKKFLQIGLGVGIVASAMQKHGVDVTVVEIDPVVIDYAARYFGFDRNYRPGGVYAEDALVWVQRAITERKQYDWVVHDVFTGGSVPSTLFAVEIFKEIKQIMSASSVLAVNYVGYLSGPNATDTLMVVHTVRSLFKHVRCVKDEHESDWHNFVIFASDQPIIFRKAGPQDFLGNSLREETLLALEKRNLEVPSPPEGQDDLFIVHRANNSLVQLQRPSALSHWSIMREIFDTAGFWIPFA